MGIIDKELVPFTKEHVKKKDLIIEMLKYEEDFTKSVEGQELYKTKLTNDKLEVIFAIHRVALTHFGFDTSDTSVLNYRTIFKTYFTDPNTYDKDVINSSFYMRNNKCVFYEKPEIVVGNKLKNCNIFELDGKTQTTLFDALSKQKFKYAFIGGFSTS